jgi:DNA-binding PadR family transcriptional regulator
MRLPTLTHLQFLILDSLLGGERSGQEVRDALAAVKFHKSGPAFYQLMARLEDAKFVAGRYKQKTIDGQPIKERRYKLLAGGRRAHDETRDFYLERLGGLVHA